MTPRQAWKLDERKFLTSLEVERLRAVSMRGAAQGTSAGIRGWMLVDVGLQTGLRVAEIAALRVSDMLLEDGRQSLIVRCGKGGKSRAVVVGDDFVRHVHEYFSWKMEIGEPVAGEAQFFWSERGKGSFSRRYLQKLFKETSRKAGLPEELSIHSLRHTYAIHLYKASGYNLRLVQKQLGHASIQVTQVYADVFDEDLRIAVGRLYSGHGSAPPEEGP